MPRVDFTTGEVLPSILDTLPDADALLMRRADVVHQLRKLRALYAGNGYMGERVFKMEEAKVDTAVRARFKQLEVKVTEPMVDAAIRQQPEYVQALLTEVEQKARWVELEEELNEIEWRLRLRTSDSYLLGAEAKLT